MFIESVNFYNENFTNKQPQTYTIYTWTIYHSVRRVNRIFVKLLPQYIAASIAGLCHKLPFFLVMATNKWLKILAKFTTTCFVCAYTNFQHNIATEPMGGTFIRLIFHMWLLCLFWALETSSIYHRTLFASTVKKKKAILLRIGGVRQQ